MSSCVAAGRLKLEYAEAAHSPILIRTVSSRDFKKKAKYLVGGCAAATSTYLSTTPVIILLLSVDSFVSNYNYLIIRPHYKMLIQLSAKCNSW